MIQKELEAIFYSFQIEQAQKRNYQFILIEIGHINQTYRATNGQTSYLLQKINTNIFKNPALLMQNVALVAKHLEQVNYSKQILQPIYTQTGQLFLIDKKKQYWRVFPFFENTYSINVPKNLRQVKMAGAAFGELMNALSTLDVDTINPTIPDFHNGNWRWQAFEQAVNDDFYNRKKEIRAFLDEVYEHQTIFQNINQVIEKNELPLRITHNDTKINNLLFDKKTHEVVAVIDWDTIMPNTILSDFGDMVRTFACSVSEEVFDENQIKFRFNVFSKICEGYAKMVQSTISHQEVEYMAKGGLWITYMQVIRFLGDYLNGDIYYHTKLPKQNLNRAKNQLTFFKEMLKKIEQMEQETDRWFR